MEKIKNNKQFYIFTFLIFYFFINIFYLTKFPFMHSDESWLSGLSRNILEKGSYNVTETFFDLKPRYPHAIKLIFHSIQILFIKLFGYNLFNMRLISLIFGVLTLYYIYKFAYQIFASVGIAFICAFLLGLDIQFIYASHFARQEIILCFLLIYGLYFWFYNFNLHSYKHDIILAVITGIGIGIHPNSFIIFLPFVFIYGYHIIFTKKIKYYSFLLYMSSVILFVLIFVGISFSFDQNFIHNYLGYGHNEFQVLNPISSKIMQIKYFYLKLYHQVSGTYYTPNIKFQFYLFTLIFFTSILRLLYTKKISVLNNYDHSIITILLSIIAINGGIILIGRFNQTSIIFQFPLFYILIGYMISEFFKKYRAIIAVLLSFSLVISSFLNISPYLKYSYDSYLKQISKAVDPNSVVLANLNSDYYFNNGKLYDYRNLAYLKNNSMDFKEYIRKNKIEYIIYPEEMDFIYQSRPLWNGIYGNPYPYYDDMHRFIQEYCKKVYEFEHSIYGIRIARYINKKDWKITIYQVNRQ